MHRHGKDPKCSKGKWEDTGAGPPLGATVSSSARPPVLEQGAPKIPDGAIPCGTLWACFSLGTMDSLGARDVHDGDAQDREVQDGEVQDGYVQDRDIHTVLGSDLASWLYLWEFFHPILLFWAICLKAWTHRCSNQIHPAQGFLRAELIPQLIPKLQGWHSIQTPPVAPPSAPWNPPHAMKRGLVGNSGKSAGLAVLRGSNPNPTQPPWTRNQGLIRNRRHSAGEEDVFSVVLGTGMSQRCPWVTDQGNASPELHHGKDLGLVSGGKTTKGFAGYPGVLAVPTLPSQTSLSSTQQPPLAMPEGAKDMLGPLWELRLCWELLLQSGHPRTVSLQGFPALLQP